MRASGGRLCMRCRDVESRYLLPGFARCAVCGGGLGVMSGSHRSDRHHVYGCLSYCKRGTAVCGNGLRLPLASVDDAVLRTIGGDVLRPAVLMAIIDGVLEALEPRRARRDVDRYRGVLLTVQGEVARLADAIATGGQLTPLLTALTTRQARARELEAAIVAAEQFDERRIDQGG
jgi:hypothetical protein